MSKPIPHGTRTGYRKHACRCLACVTYQRRLSKRYRDRMSAEQKCRDCCDALSAEDIAAGHRRDQKCRDRRNQKQRGSYVATPGERVQRPRVVHRVSPAVRVVVGELSPWERPREGFTQAMQQRVVELERAHPPIVLHEDPVQAPDVVARRNY